MPQTAAQTRAQHGLFSHPDSVRGMLTPLRTCYNVSAYNLHLRFVPQTKLLTGYADIAYKTEQPFRSLQLDLYANMVIDSLQQLSRSNQAGTLLPATRPEYSHTGNAVYVAFAEEQPLGSGALRVYYHGSPQPAVKPPWDGGLTYSTDTLGFPWIGLSCEGLGASLWFPCKDHLSDEPDSVHLSMEVPTGLMCVSNGNLTDSLQLPDGFTRFNWAVRYPINSYNITFNIARYAHLSEQFSQTEGTKKLRYAIDYYVLRQNKEIAEKHFRQVTPMLRCFNYWLGPYPFPTDGYALVETPYWGMEHQSAVSYGNRYKNLPEGFDFIIVHESGHEYWGNLVSVADAADMWIHEGFCTYTETLYLQCLKGPAAALAYINKQKKLIKNHEPVVGPYGVNYHNRPDNDIYYKGAWILHTLRSIINNDTKFRGLLKGLLREFAFKQTSTESLIKYLNGYLGTDYSAFFNQYLHHTGLPCLQYSIQGPNINFRWLADDPNFAIPVDISLNGKRVRLHPRADRLKTLKMPAGIQNVSTQATEQHFLVRTQKLEPEAVSPPKGTLKRPQKASKKAPLTAPHEPARKHTER